MQFGRDDMRPDAFRNISPSDAAPTLAVEPTLPSPNSDIRSARPRPMPGPGERIAETYVILGTLGGGAMGTVLSAFDERLERKVAIKLIHAELRTAQFRELFHSEARAMAQVSHPNVVTIHAFGDHGDAPYMVMELVEGQTLDAWLAAQPAEPDLDEALRILNQICLGVSAIHDAGTLHRDLKPGNILLDHQMRVRVSDLGLAIPLDDGTRHKETVGTVGYIAPEIYFDIATDSGATQKSDLYSLACIAFELLTGQPPYAHREDSALAVLHGTAPIPVASDRRANLPAAFDRVLEQAMAKDPKQRTPNVELFRRALIEARNDSLEPVRILVAEDDPDFRELLEVALSQEFPGADIECVADGRLAIEAFDRKPASVVVIDLQMPELDGMGVTALLRARPNALQAPIIVVSASGGAGEWSTLASLGADRFLVKPVPLDDLISAIRRATRERSSRPPSTHASSSSNHA